MYSYTYITLHCRLNGTVELMVQGDERSHMFAFVPLAESLSPESALWRLLLERVRVVCVQIEPSVSASGASDVDVFETVLLRYSEEFHIPFNPRGLYLSLPPALVWQHGLVPGVGERAELQFRLERSPWLDVALYAVECLRTPDLLFPNTLPEENTLLYKKIYDIMSKYSNLGLSFLLECILRV